MRNLFILSVAFILSCSKDNAGGIPFVPGTPYDSTKFYLAEIPIFEHIDQYAKTIKSVSAKPIVNAGKLLIYDQLIYLVEKEKGIHIINNSNPNSPQKFAFIECSAVEDIHMRNNLLYVIVENKMLVIDMTSPYNPKFLHYIKDLGNYFGSNSQYNPYFDSILVGYKQILMPLDQYYLCDYTGVISSGSLNQGGPIATSADIKSNTGKVGSLAKVSIIGDCIYIINQSGLLTYKINHTAAPKYMSSTHIGWQLETIFGYMNRLYLASRNGLYIYSLDNPEMPAKLGEYSHVNSCDPVVVEGNYAYVTLRKENDCMDGVNELNVIDVSNPQNPQLVKKYGLHNPFGLGIDKNSLFVCDGNEGLKVFDVSDKLNIDKNKIAQFSGIKLNDVIPYMGYLIAVSDNSIMQYNYQNLTSITLASVIK